MTDTARSSLRSRLPQQAWAVFDAWPEPCHALDVSPEGEWFVFGHPAMLGVGVIANAMVAVAEPVIEWRGQVPEVTFPTRGETDLAAVDAAWLERSAAEVLSLRRARFATCRSCGESNPPEWIDRGRCHRCMERDGAVF